MFECSKRQQMHYLGVCVMGKGDGGGGGGGGLPRYFDDGVCD